MQNHPSTIRKYLQAALICAAVLLSSCKPSQSMDSLDGDTSTPIKHKERHRETDFSIPRNAGTQPTPPTAAVHVKEKLKKLPAPSPQEQAEAKTTIQDYLNQHPEQKDTFHNLTKLLELNEGYFIDGCASIGGGLEAFEGFMKILSHDFDQRPRHKPGGLRLGNKTGKASLEDYIQQKNNGTLSKADKKDFKKQRERLTAVFKTFIREVKAAQTKN